MYVYPYNYCLDIYNYLFSNGITIVARFTITRDTKDNNNNNNNDSNNNYITITIKEKTRLHNDVNQTVRVIALGIM